MKNKIFNYTLLSLCLLLSGSFIYWGQAYRQNNQQLENQTNTFVIESSITLKELSEQNELLRKRNLLLEKTLDLMFQALEPEATPTPKPTVTPLPREKSNDLNI
jgi:hypothetical protein